jgi:hypothetical protein
MLVPVKAETAWYNDLVWGRNRVIASSVLRGPVPGRWYRLDERWGSVELLELRGRVNFAEGEKETPSWSGFFASAVVLYNAGKRPVLPDLERMVVTSVSRKAKAPPP